MRRPKLSLMGDPSHLQRVWGGSLARLETLAEVGPQSPDTEVIGSTWGMPLLSAAELDAMPSLRLVLYAAGDVRGFAAPLVSRGVEIVSAWRANAEPVAEFTLAQILLSMKGYFRNVEEYRASRQMRGCHVGPGSHGETVALIGYGAVAQRLVGLLMPLRLRVLIVDPFVAAAPGCEIVGLEEAFERALVVSNHVPDNESTRGMLGGSLFGRMRAGATFINTGRGQTLVESEFVQVMRARRDLMALLDVTHPEPLPADSPLWSLPNVRVSTHIAGSVGNELSAMADLCLDELGRYVRGEPLLHRVPTEALRP